jgi:DNA-binding transcriptional LysR family regulator
MTQPALSKSIKRLEDEFGVSLFERAPRGVIPTQFATALAAPLSQVLGHVSLAHKTVELMKGGRTGQVTIAAGPSVARVILVPAIMRFTRSHPDVEIRIIEGLEGRIAEALAKGEADLAAAGEFEPFADQEYRQATILDDRLVVYSSDPRLAGHSSVPPDLLTQLDFVLMDETDRLRLHLARQLVNAGLAVPSPRITVNSVTLLIDYLRLPGISTILPESLRAVALQGDQRGVATYPIEGVTLPWRAKLYWRRGAILSEAAKAMMAAIKAPSKARSAA